MKSKKAISLAWAQLRGGNASESGLSIPTVPSEVKTEIDNIRFALSTENKPRLLLPISAHERLPEFPDTAGVSITEAVYRQSGKSIRFIDMTCLIKDLESVFDDVANEIVTRIDHGDTCSQALLSTLRDFQALLTGKSGTGLSDAELIGLMGELVFLRELLKVNKNAWVTWQGPLAKRHDFRSDLCTLEVKTTSRPSNYCVSINSVDQLETPSSGELHLIRMVMEYSPNSNLTFNSLLNEVKELSSNPNEIVKRLKKVGIEPDTAHEWGEIPFRLESREIYRVMDNFPRITQETFLGSHLPAGVLKLRYEIDLSMAQNYKLDNDDAAALIQGFSK
jgi:hypothetical protein